MGHIDQNRCVQRWPGQNSWVSTNWNRQHHLRSLHCQVFSFKLTSGWTAKSRMTLRPDDSSLLHLGQVVPAKRPNDYGDVRCSISCHRGKMFHQGLWIGLQGRILINEYGKPGLGYVFPFFGKSLSWLPRCFIELKKDSFQSNLNTMFMTSGWL